MSKQTTQSSTSFAKVSHALKMLSQLCEKREDELVGIPTHAINEESDVENDSESPMSNCFLVDHKHQ